ncbi:MULTISPECIES: hypothetical protein [Psychrobacter]|uniref:hypothetical protein n=1 Tax=Psychrobacter TaxID=497 RepID=UPI0017877E75|nr:hypothetical protein [Psychrobacter sp. FME6]MBE0407917.1 hypothetical protein [Psychrobacter sp. FME6]
MSKLLTLLAVSALTLPVIACSSSGAPSDSDVKKLVLSEVARNISDQSIKDQVEVDYTECKATETEGKYFCVVSVGVDYQGERQVDTRGWSFTKANDNWFIKGPLAISGADRDKAEGK